MKSKGKKQGGANKRFGINKFPTTKGIIFWGISMGRIGNAQSPQKCREHLEHLASKVAWTEGIGVVMWYGDYLYFYSDRPAYQLRNKFMELMISHKHAFINRLRKDRKWTLQAFSFNTFGRLLLDNSGVFQGAYKIVQRMYKTDKDFKTLVNNDYQGAGHNAGDNEFSFILEEITAFYLAQKGVLKLGNEFVKDSEKEWVLQVYPGKPLKSEIYLFQKNPLKLSNPKNPYENSYYDLEEQVLYDYLKEG